MAGPGTSVILPAPWYFNHQMTLQMLGIGVTPLPCRPEDRFVPDVAAAEALIDATTRALVLVTPNNPTGAIYPEGVIAAFADLARRRGVALIVDETYRDFLADGPTGPMACWRGPTGATRSSSSIPSPRAMPCPAIAPAPSPPGRRPWGKS